LTATATSEQRDCHLLVAVLKDVNMSWVSTVLSTIKSFSDFFSWLLLSKDNHCQVNLLQLFITYGVNGVNIFF